MRPRSNFRPPWITQRHTRYAVYITKQHGLIETRPEIHHHAQDAYACRSTRTDTRHRRCLHPCLSLFPHLNRNTQPTFSNRSCHPRAKPKQYSTVARRCLTTSRASPSANSLPSRLRCSSLFWDVRGAISGMISRLRVRNLQVRSVGVLWQPVPDHLELYD